MDRRLRRAPDAEWVLMYRSGLSRARIGALVGAPPATIGYHLVIARRQDPDLEVEHRAAAGTAPVPGLSPAELARMGEVIAWVTARGRFPTGKATDRHERSLALRLARRRRDAATGTLHPAYREGLARVPGWDINPRTVKDEARWHDRLGQLVAFRAEGNDFPRHHHYTTEREHILGVWIHTQRYMHRAGDLDLAKLTLLDDAVPGWQTGRTRGRLSHAALHPETNRK